MLTLRPHHFRGGAALLVRTSGRASLQEFLGELQEYASSAEEGLVVLDTRVDAAEEDIAGLDTRVDAAETAITSLDSRLDTAEASLETLVEQPALPIPGSEGEALISNGTSWVSQAIPNAYTVGASGTILVSNGATYVPLTITAALASKTLPNLFDCLSDPAVSGWGRALSGTGAISAISGSSSTHPGQWRFLVGSGTASRAVLHLGPSTGGPLTPDASMTGYFEVMLKMPVVSGGGQAIEVIAGFADNAASTTPSNGVYFFINTSNQLIARRTVSGVNQDTTVTTIVADTWYRLRAEYVGTNTVLSWGQTENRDAALTVALTTAKINTAQGPQLRITRAAGSTSREINVDYLWWHFPKA